MFWQKLLNEFYNRPPDQKAEFYPPVSKHNIFLAEQELQVTLPKDLKDLLEETDGVGDLLYMKNQSKEILIGYLIWPLQKIIDENRDFRTNPLITKTYMPFDNLLFFSEAGNGDLFGFAITNHYKCSNRIYRWDHEDDSRLCIANSLKEFLLDVSE